MLSDFADEYRRYRIIGERALTQLTDPALNHIPAPDGNSAAMIVRHLSGNLVSRFTDFLTTDGEKPWRDREKEFEERTYSRAEVDTLWSSGWDLLERTVGTLREDDLPRSVTIRGEPFTVHGALCRSLAHVGYHVGQLVLLGRQGTHAPWRWISIPKGASEAYNAAPYMEKRPL